MTDFNREIEFNWKPYPNDLNWIAVYSTYIVYLEQAFADLKTPLQQIESLENSLKVEIDDPDFGQVGNIDGPLAQVEYIEELVNGTLKLVKAADPENEKSFEDTILLPTISNLVAQYDLMQPNNQADAEFKDEISLKILDLVIACSEAGFNEAVLRLSQLFSRIVKSVINSSAKIFLEKIKKLEVKHEQISDLLCYRRVIRKSFMLSESEFDAAKTFVQNMDWLNFESLIKSNKSKYGTACFLLRHLYPKIPLHSFRIEIWQKCVHHIEKIAEIYKQAAPLCTPMETFYDNYLDLTDIFRLHLKTGDSAAIIVYCKRTIDIYKKMANRHYQDSITAFCESYRLDPQLLFFESQPNYVTPRFYIRNEATVTVGFMNLYLRKVDEAMANFSSLSGVKDVAPSDHSDQSEGFVKKDDDLDTLLTDEIIFAQVGLICCYLQQKQKFSAMRLMSALSKRIEKEDEATNAASTYSEFYTKLNDCADQLFMGKINCQQAKEFLLKNIVGFDFGVTN